MTLSLDTAYRSFGGEVEASSTPTICRLSDSRRHQLWAIARRAWARSLSSCLQHGSWGIGVKTPGPALSGRSEQVLGQGEESQSPGDGARAVSRARQVRSASQQRTSTADWTHSPSHAIL